MKKEIDKNKIWITIWYGGDFIVKMYWKSEVIKYSTLSCILWENHRKKMISDYQVCKKYFKDFVVETDVIEGLKKYIEIQKYIKWEKLQKHHFKDKFIQEQFLEIIKIVETMRKKGIESIDLVGIDGILRNYFGNIIVDEKWKLNIIDASLLESKSIWVLHYIFDPLMHIAKILQKRMIKKYFLKIKQSWYIK